MSYAQKKNFRKLFSSKIFLVFVGVLLIWLGVSVGQESYRKYQLAKQINDLKLEMKKLQDTNQQLANLIEFYNQQSYLEKEARLKLNLVQPGEKVIIVPESEFATSQKSALGQDQQAQPSQSPESELKWWKFWEYLF